MTGVELRPGLPRRVFFGVRLDEDDQNGARVLAVHPGSSAAQIGIIAGDRLFAVGSSPVRGPAELMRCVARLAPGEAVEVEVARGLERRRLRGLVRPWPTETFPGSTLILDHVGPPGRRQRVFLTRPEGEGPHPAVMLMRGFSCRSCEFPLRPETPMRLLIAAWARAGLCTLRVEKPGVGDSEGPPCPDNTFAAELDGARAGLELLIRAGFVDRDRIALFGHSVGGMIAPILASERPVAAIGTLGTSADRFNECASASRRRQFVLGGASLESLENLAAMESLQALLVREGMSVNEAVARRPELRRAVPRLLPGGRLFGRALTYTRQLDRADVEGAWRRVDAEVAVFHAEHDYVCTREEAARIVELVNREGCGRARLVELPGVGHLLYTHPSLAAAYAEPEVGSTETGIVEATLAWMERAFARAPAGSSPRRPRDETGA